MAKKYNLLKTVCVYAVACTVKTIKLLKIKLYVKYILR